MKRSGFLLICLLLSLPAAAQYKWVDANGKVQYTDTPPPAGAKADQVRNRSSSVSGPAEQPAGKAGAAKGAAKDAGKDAAASKRPLTAAEQDQAYRKRKLDEEEAQKKAAEKQTQESQKQENCTNAKNNVASIEAGGRQSRINAKGERYFLDDSQVQAELAKARAQVTSFCN